MVKSFKENIIFITSSVLLVGLFVGVSQLRKSSANQSNTDQIPTISTRDTAGPQTTPDITTEPIADIPVTQKISKPTPPPVVPVPARPRFNGDDEEEDD